MANQIEVLRLLKILGDVFPSFHLNSSAIEIYVQLLADIPTQVLEQATKNHICRSTFFPAIAELRNAAFDILETLQPIPTDFEAWAEVQDEINRVGWYGSPEFNNPITATAVEQLGWHSLCFSQNLVADRAHFLQAYHTLVESRRRAIRRFSDGNQFIADNHFSHNPLLSKGNLLQNQAQLDKETS